MPWKAWLAVLVIFAAGIFTGVMTTRMLTAEPATRPAANAPLPISPEKRMDYLARLDREVQLTPEQRAEIEQIIAGSQERLRELWDPVAPKVREEYRSTRRQIASLLTTEQKEALEKARKERRQREANPARANTHSQVNP